MSPLKIAIASGKGGTGKTFVSTNLFHSLSDGYGLVTLVDCDAEAPNDREFIAGKEVDSFQVTQQIPVIDESKCVFCGKCYEYCNYNAIFYMGETRIIQVMEELCHGCGACSVACEYGAITEKEDELGVVTQLQITENSRLIEARMRVGVHSPVDVIKAAVRSAAGADIILMDAPPGTSCPFIQTVAQADYVVLVTEPTPFGLSDLRQSVDTLRSMDIACGVIVNRAGLGDDEVYRYLDEEKIPLLMSVPFDRAIATAYSNGKLLSHIDEEWKKKFIQLYEQIVKLHGNSSN